MYLCQNRPCFPIRERMEGDVAHHSIEGGSRKGEQSCHVAQLELDRQTVSLGLGLRPLKGNGRVTQARDPETRACKHKSITAGAASQLEGAGHLVLLQRR